MKKIFTLMAAVLMLSTTVNAQINVDEAKAKFIYNFTKFFEWPSSERSGDFVIGVMGSKKMYDEVVAYTKGKKVITQNITVKYFRNADEASECHMLYVSKYKSNDLQGIYKKTGHYTLIVSDSNNGIERGSALNFVLDGNRLRYEFSGENALKLGLKFSSRIKEMAVNNG